MTKLLGDALPDWDVVVVKAKIGVGIGVGIPETDPERGKLVFISNQPLLGELLNLHTVRGNQQISRPFVEPNINQIAPPFLTIF